MGSKGQKIWHWSKLPEKGTLLGLRISLWCYRLLGRRLTYLLIYPVMAYFFLTSPQARRSSRKYLEQAENYALSHVIAFIKPSSFKHFIAFGQSIIDKLAVWSGKIGYGQINFPNKQVLMSLVAQKKGAVIFTAHLGNMEITRALSRLTPGLKVNALVFNKHAQKFNQTLNAINADFSLSMIEVNDIDMCFAMRLQEKIDRGELIVIACDRTSVTKPDKNLQADFLGKKAYFPQGAFILAATLKAPAYTMLCLKQKDKHFHVVFEHFADELAVQRKNKLQSLTRYAQQYSDFLTPYCLAYPEQWFNFFDFWAPMDHE
ncbi:LpxL/LpxP family acyltransferase [Facilibium subflavum]|uniref:LpxL/LpxP family acyltransferase n=1 Tax=Facilibium subflavum TaxID=2219058 RepID=UPI000E65BD0C|nr:acyltransferase [Facilibium subflavum]